MEVATATAVRVWTDEPTPPRREKLWIKHEKKCHWCKQPTRLRPKLPNGSPDNEAWDMATIDHVIPRHRGGSDEEDNLVSACRLCNNRRSHEDNCHLPDGSLLGQYSPRQKKQQSAQLIARRHVALTADEKKAIMAGNYQPAKNPTVKRSVEEVLREQRDQAMKEIASLKAQLACSQAVRKDLDEKLRTITVGELACMRMIRFLRITMKRFRKRKLRA